MIHLYRMNFRLTPKSQRTYALCTLDVCTFKWYNRDLLEIICSSCHDVIRYPPWVRVHSTVSMIGNFTGNRENELYIHSRKLIGLCDLFETITIYIVFTNVYPGGRLFDKLTDWRITLQASVQKCQSKHFIDWINFESFVIPVSWCKMKDTIKKNTRLHTLFATGYIVASIRYQLNLSNKYVCIF
jgi:hypothetical protein